jgi:chlorite dismutase
VTASTEPAAAASQLFVQAVALGLDPAWRRLDREEQRADGSAFVAAESDTAASGVRTLVYSSVGLEPGVDLLLLRLADSIDMLEAAGARLARNGLGRWLSIRTSLLGRVAASQYVA